MENKIIPDLRFPGFEDDWQKASMNEIAKVIDCKHRTPPYVEDGIPVVSPGTIKWGKIDLVTPVKRVTNDVYESLMDHCLPQAGDLVFSRNQSIGVASIVSHDEKFVLGQDTVLIQSTSTNSIFLYYYLQTYSVQNTIRKLAGGSTFSRINLKDIRQFKFNSIPTESTEQSKIANFLTAIDKRINLLQQKRTELERYKKGVMQKLFSQTIRFKKDDGSDFPNWEEKKLGESFDFLRGAGLSKNDMSETGINKCIHYGELFTTYSENINKVTSKTNIDGNRSRAGDILMPSSDVTPTGLATASAVFENDIILGGDINILRPKTAVNSSYISYLLNFSKREIIKLVTGTTVKHIYNKDVKQLKFNIPHKDEQQKIAIFLSSMDRKIEMLSDQIDNSLEFKQGLLQKMFV